MGSLMDGLAADAYERTYSDWQLVRRIAQYFRPETGRMLMITFLAIGGTLLETGMTILLARGIDFLVSAYALSTTMVIILAILLVGVGSWICSVGQQWFTYYVVGRIVLNMRQKIFASVLVQDMSFYDQYASGRIVSRVLADTEDFSSVISLVLTLLGQIILVTMLMSVLCTINIQLALLVCGMVPLIVLAALGFRRIARQTTRQSLRVQANMNGFLQKSLGGIAIAKSFRQEQALLNEFVPLNQQAYTFGLRNGLIYSAIFPILRLLAGLGSAAVVYIGGIDVLAHTVSPGAWFLFMQAVGLFWFPLTGMASFWSQFQQGLAAGERIFALIDTRSKVQQHVQQVPSQIRGEIELRDLCFGYTDREMVFENFNLTIQAGETVALVGETGSGKTSLTRLVARFYEFQGGQLLIDGTDIRALGLARYRRCLGIISQVPLLFSGTVEENIRYGRSTASDREVEEAARSIGGGDWLRSLTEGLQTQVGESGKGLSMGQRQLIALARLLLQDPSIVLLDEATASVDPLTEAQMQEGLDVTLKGRTALVIAHRLSTVERADRLIVLKQGRILEEGTHEQLLAYGGYYAHLYNSYFRHQSPGYNPGTGFVTVHADEG